MSKKIKEDSYIKIDYIVKDFKMQDVVQLENLKNKIEWQF